VSRRREIIPKPRSSFLRVRCPDCGNEQIVFSEAKRKVTCNICKAVITEPGGGKASIRGEIAGVLG
jgi:small subunit ribosomal protein S27e